jgi:FlaG/FlaF family flagellin (archaellin)
MRDLDIRRDGRGDSSTTGIILMVGVGVVLAGLLFNSFAGIAGDSLVSTPNAELSLEFDEGASAGFGTGDADDSITIRHENGDTIEFDEFEVRVGGVTVKDSSDLSFASTPSELESSDEVTITEDSSGAIASGMEIIITFEDNESDKTSVLLRGEVP